MTAAPPPAPDGAGRWSRADVAWLAVAVAIALALRLREAMRVPIGFDEIYYVLAARHPAADLLNLAAHDIHPPLSFMAVWAWRALGGEQPPWLKALPLLVALATVALAFVLGRAWFGRLAGGLAAVLLALHPLHVRYGQEIEVYGALWLMPLALCGAAWFVVTTGARRGRALWVVAGALAWYTHYLSAFVIAPILVWGALVLRRDPPALRRWAWCAVAIAIAALPQLPTAYQQFVREGSGHYYRWPTLEEWWEVARHAALGVGWLVPVVFGLALAPFAWTPRRRVATLLAVVTLTPLLARRVLPIVVSRDLLFVTPLVLILVSGGLAGIDPRARLALGALLLAWAVRAALVDVPLDEPVDLSRARAFLETRVRPDELVVATETHAFLFLRYHAPGLGRQRVWVPDGGQVPFFEGGLVVPDSLRLEDRAFTAARAGGSRWWGIRVDRAYVSRGRVSRAGAAGAAVMDSLMRVGGGARRTFGKATVWEGGRP